MLEAIQDGDSTVQIENQKLKALKDYAPTWGIFETTVDEQTGTFHQTMKTKNKEKMKVFAYCRVALR